MRKFYILFLVGVGVGLGQPFDGVGLGMAGNYTALSRGVYSMAYNPANLALVRYNALEVNLVSAHMAIFNNSFSLDDYNRYFTYEGHGGKWSEQDKKEMLNLISSEGLTVSGNVGVNALGIAINNFGITIQSLNLFSVKILKDEKLLQAALFGDDFSRDYAYEVESFADGSAISAVKLAVGYAYRWDAVKIPYLNTSLDYLSAGVNMNHFLGYAALHIKKAAIQLNRSETDNGDPIKYKIRTELLNSFAENAAPAGYGLGVDMGAAARYRKKWLFSFSINNLFAKINWDRNVERTVKFLSDSAAAKDILGEDRDPFIQEEDSTYSGGSFKTPIPSTLRFAAAWKALYNLTLTAEWEQGIDHYLGNSITPRIGVGAVYLPLMWLPVRGGVSFGGRHGFLFGVGTGVKFKKIQFDISTAVDNAIIPYRSEGVYIAAGIRLTL
jgi:hypothetical protein